MSHRTSVGALLLAANASLGLAVGCYDRSICEYADCDAGGAGGGATGSTSGSPTGSSSTGLPPGCDLVEGQAIDASCGAFVKLGGSGVGTQADPVGSVVDGVAASGNQARVYVCGADTFEGSVSIVSGVSILGGLDCGTWTFKGANPHPKIKGDANVPALSVTPGPTATSFLASVDVESVDATDAGQSSIAVLANGSQLSLSQVDIHAGAGATGAVGMPQTAVGQAPMGMGGATGCTGAVGVLGGGGGGQLTCQGTDVGGGLGGSGTNLTSGGNGNPGSGPSPGSLGAGETSTLQCTNGGQGNPGSAGNPGPGALETELGTLTEAGYIGALGGVGESSGTPGSGGGGGGGANLCTGSGPSGGGGGAGGCGGAPGNPGGGGGGSFALISIGSAVTLTAVTLAAGPGGVGGAGDAGQDGQAGGSAGPAGGPNDACPGGKGGNGGRGGAGGGGRGGPSVGIASVGTAPAETMVTITVAPTPAMGGAGGDGGGANQGGVGADGLVAQRQAW